MGPKPELIRAVLDTNVLISVFLFGGRLEGLRVAWKIGRLRIVACKELLDEIVRALSYPRFRLTPKEISSLLHKELLPFVEIVDLSGRTENASRDPDDDIAVRCSLAGGCSWLISGDEDLLAIGEYQGVEILSPRAFMDKVLGAG